MVKKQHLFYNNFSPHSPQLFPFLPSLLFYMIAFFAASVSFKLQQFKQWDIAHAYIIINSA